MAIKKILAALLALSMTVSMAACGNSSTQTNTTTQTEQAEQTQEEKEPAQEESTQTEESTEAESAEAETEQTQPAEKVDINLAALSGPTALGMLDLLEKNDNGEAANNYNVTSPLPPMR